jgi:hypothetical protein
MHRYYFDLISTEHVPDATGAVLSTDEEAIRVARDLARDVRDNRPELVGQGYEILVRTDSDAEISRVAIDTKGPNGR